MHVGMSAHLSVRPSVSQIGPDRTVCLSVRLDVYLYQCVLLSVIRAVHCPSLRPDWLSAMPPFTVHPVCPDCPSLGNARRDLSELHPEHSPSWRCPPGCQHCFHMGRPTDLILQTPLTVYSAMCQAAIPHTPKRPRPVWCKEYTTEYLNEKFTKTTAKWQRRWQ